MKNYPTFEQGITYEEIHADFESWLYEIGFYKEEISFFEERLGNASLHLKNNDASRFVEQIQNKLILQKEQVDILRHELNERQQKLVDFIKTHANNIEFIKFNDHKEMRDKVETHRRLYNELKKDFYLKLPQISIL